MVVLSAIPFAGAVEPADDRRHGARPPARLELCGDERVLMHGGVQPTVGPPGLQIDGMSRLVAEHPIAAWKMYTHAPGRGWWLDDHDAAAPQVGNAFLARVEEIGPRIVCVHKGFSGGIEYASPVDIGPAAKAHPTVTFVVYHSGFESTGEEGPVHRRDRRPRGEPADHDPAPRRASGRARTSTRSSAPRGGC